MGRVTYSGPVKSTGGFEVGAGRSAGGTNTTIIDSSGNITTTGNVYGKTPVVSVSDDTTVTSAQTGAVFIVSATGDVTITLPSTAAGLDYTFFPDPDVALNVSPATADGIIGRLSTSATAILAATGEADKDLISAASLNTLGDYLRLIGDGSSGWYIAGGIGTWSVET